jgi:hypothetical protein
MSAKQLEAKVTDMCSKLDNLDTDWEVLEFQHGKTGENRKKEKKT